MRAAVLTWLLAVVPVAAAAPMMGFGTWILPGDRIDLVLEVPAGGEARIGFEAPVPLEWGARPAAAPENLSAAASGEANLSGATSVRWIATWLNPTSSDVRADLMIEGDGILVESRGLRQVEPAAWRTPGLGLVAAIVAVGLAAKLGARRC